MTLPDPGPELDAIVAEKVLGEAKPPDPDVNEYREQGWFQQHLSGNPHKSDCGGWVVLFNYDHNDKPEWHPRPFSTYNHAALDMLVEKFPGRWSMRAYPGGPPDDTIYHEVWTHKPHPGGDFCGVADTLAHAAAVAALKAVGYEA